MNNRQGNLKFVLAAVLAMGLAAITPARAQTAIGGNLQVFTDMSLIESLTTAMLKQHEPGQRPNGTGSVNAGYTGGEMITKPITFTGRRLVLNYATSAAGSIRVEIQDVNGVPKTGYALANFPERYLDEVEGIMSWSGVVDVGSLAGTTVRLRFVLKDADLYAMRFANPDNVQYSVSYNANGANGGTAPSTQQKEKGVSLVLAMNGGDPFLYKTGYTFAGWNTAANGSGTSYDECATYTNDAALTLYARWAANPTTYTVTFNKNGATSGLGPAALNKVQGVALTLPSNISLAKTAYTFAGWNTAANGSGTNYAAGASYPTDAAVTFYANWSAAATYAVTYNANGATSGTAPASQTKTQDVALTLATNSGNLAKTGFIFSGWNTAADGSGTSYSEGATYTANAAATLYAKWAAAGSGVVATGGTVTENGGYRIHTFTGGGTLSVTAGGEVEYLIVAGGGGSGGVNGNNAGGAGGAGGLRHNVGGTLLTVSAQSYPVVVGTGGAGGPTTGNRGSNGSDSSVFGLTALGGGGGGGDLNATQRVGASGGSGGGGGDSGAGGSGTAGQGNAGANNYGKGGGAGQSGASATTPGQGLQIDINGTPTYYAGGGSNPFTSSRPLGGGGFGDETQNGNQATDGVANTGGGGGARWTSVPTAGKSGGSGIVIVRYPLAMTVIYNANGATSGTAPASQTKTQDVVLTLATNSGTLAKTGYTFSGWNTAANGSGTDYAEGGSYTNNAGVTLYAKWTGNTYTVAYNANGATGGTAPASQTKTQDVALTLATNSGNLAKTGFIFSGWNTAADGSGTNYAVGSSYTANAAATLYAKWTPVPSGGGVVTETFDTAASTTANGWTGSGNTGGSNNFGWSNTGNVLGTGGEAGGTFARSASFRYFADTNGGTLARTDTLQMSGSFRLVNEDYDGGFYLGFFDTAGLVSGSAPANFVGILFEEPANSGPPNYTPVPTGPFRGAARVNGTGGAGSSVISLTQDTTLTFNLTWTGSPDGSGTLTGTVAGTDIGSIAVAAGSGSFNALGLVNGGANLDNPTLNTAGCFFDDLTYTAVAPASYTITYNANGNTSGTVPDDQTKTENQPLTLATNSGNLTKTGFTFVGWNTAADGSGTSYAEGGSYTANAGVTLYANWAGAVEATGGTVTENGGYRIHTFTSSDTLSVTTGGEVEVLVVGGGGGGGAGRAHAFGTSGGGGGGAGGVVYSSSYLLGAGPIAVTVGGGGNGAAALGKGDNGSSSAFATLTAGGGGGGASPGGSAGGSGAATGGSGGGGSWNGDGDSGGTALANGTGSTGGYNGGACSGPRYPGGGGGGAGGGGANNNTLYGAGAAGGAGITNAISGTAQVYAGGGGGGVGGWWVGTADAGAGGSGVGGTGGYGAWPDTLPSTPGGAGAANTGSGGGGGPPTNLGNGPINGGNGAAGIVIVRYEMPSGNSGFATWQAANDTAGGLNDDHDNDGVDNGVEWFLGGNANTSGFTALPAVTNTGGTLSVTWTKSADYPGNYGTGFRVETSATLANPWTPATVGGGPGFVEITGNNVKFTFPAGVKDFARLVVTGP